MKRFVLGVSIYLLWFAAVFDPVGNMYGLRFLSLGFAVFCMAISLSPGTPRDARALTGRLLLFWTSFLMPVYGVFMYSLRAGSTDFVDTSYIAAGILILSTLIYRDEGLCRRGISALVFSLRLLTVVITFIYLNIFFEFNKDWLSFFTERNVAIIATREYGGVVLPYIYFLASPMLIYLIAHELHRFGQEKSAARLALCGMAMFAFGLSGTRAHMILAVAYAPLYYLLTSRHRRTAGIVAGFGAAAALLVLVGPDLLGELFSTKETSNQLKLELLDMYADVVSDPLSLLIGQGYNAHEWYAPLRERLSGIEGASKTELTYLELVRVYGIVIAGAFFALIIAVGRRAARLPAEYRWLFPAYVIYMANAALNPYLFSTNGMLPLALLTALVSLPPRTPDRRLVGTPPADARALPA